MNRRDKYIKLIFLSTLFTLVLWVNSCTSTYSVDEYMEFCATDEAYVKRIEEKRFSINCSYRTSTFLSINEFLKQSENKEELSVKEIEESAKKYDNAYYFDVKIGLDTKENLVTNLVESQEDYSTLINYLTYNIQNDFFILTDMSDTLKPLVCNYYNTYGMGKTIDLTIAFQKPENKKINNIKLIYRDRFLSIKHDLIFEFELSKLNKQIKIIN